MTLTEFKEALRAYIDEISGEEPTERDISMLEAIEDYTEPETVTEEAIEERIAAAVAENEAAWTKRFKDRFYGREDGGEAPAASDPAEVTEPEVVTNDPEEEELKSILDFEW